MAALRRLRALVPQHLQWKAQKQERKPGSRSQWRQAEMRLLLPFWRLCLTVVVLL